MAGVFGCLCLSFITMEMNSPAPTKQITTAAFPEGKLIMLTDGLELAYLNTSPNPTTNPMHKPLKLCISVHVTS